MNTFKTFFILLILFMMQLTLCAQDINSKYTSDINGLRIHQIHTKQEIIAKFGTPTKYEFADYTDEGMGIGEEYNYEDEFVIRSLAGEIWEIWTKSPKYVFFNHIKVGDNVSKAYEMVNDGHARKGIVEPEENGYYSLHLYLGDMSFYVYYKNNIIYELLYNVPM